MKPLLFEGHDVVLGAPEGWDADKHGPCDGLPIMRQDGRCISIWSFDDRERAAVAAGANLHLHVCSGLTQPPVALAVGHPDPAAGEQSREIVAYGDGTPMGTELVDVTSGRRIVNVRRFTTFADAEKPTGIVLFMSILGAEIELGAIVPDPRGLRCSAFIVAHETPGGT